MRALNRVQPVGPPSAYKTFTVLQPLATHFRPATCAEVDCPNYLNGWKTEVDTSTELGAAQADYIRHRAGRAFVESADRLPVVTFLFHAGQPCFAEHHEPLERPPIHIVRNGDWRAGDNVREVRPDDWVDDFQNHQARLADQIERG